MFSIPHLVVIFIVVLVVFGPHKLPELAKGLGKLMAEFRKASTDFKLAFEEEMRNIERHAREVEIKKAEAAGGGTAPALPAPAGTGGDVIDVEPVISPVAESVAREAEAGSLPSEEPAVSSEAESKTPSQEKHSQ